MCLHKNNLFMPFFKFFMNMRLLVPCFLKAILMKVRGTTISYTCRLNFFINISDCSFLFFIQYLFQFIQRRQSNVILEKGFQKKPIVAFTNSTVFILDFNV